MTGCGLMLIVAMVAVHVSSRSLIESRRSTLVSMRLLPKLSVKQSSAVEAIVGTWSTSAMGPVSEPQLITFTDGKVHWPAELAADPGMYSIDESTSPARITMTVSICVCHGVVRVTENDLELCFNTFCQGSKTLDPVPGDFTAKDDPQFTYFAFTRVSSSDSAP